MEKQQFINRSEKIVESARAENKKRGVLIAALVILAAVLAPIAWQFSVLLLIAAAVPCSAMLQNKRKIERLQNEIAAAGQDFERFQNDRQKQHAAAVQQLRQSQLARPPAAARPRCPTCGSFAVRPVSTAARAVSVAAVGLASSKIGKTYECTACGYKW